MVPSCVGSSAPYTLLGALLRDGSYAPSWPACGGRAFLRDYAQRGTNALLWAGLLVVTWVLLCRIAALLRLWALGSRLPGPPALFADPGLAAVCRAGGDITGYLSKLHGSFGPVVRLWVGPSQLLVSVKDASLIKEILAKAEDKLPLTERTYNLACGRLGLFISSFEKVRSSRELLEVFLNEKLNVGASASSFKIIEAVLGRVNYTMDKDPLDCRFFSQHMAFNIIGAALFGEVFFDWSDAAAYEELLMIVAKDGCFWASYGVPPFWKPAYRKYRGLCAKLKILTEGIIRKSIDQSSLLSHNALRSCNKSEGVVKGPVGCTSLLDGIISGRCLYGAVEGPLSSEEEICGNIVGLMLHGINASANLVGSILTRLVLYPKLKDQLYADIVAVCNQSSELEVEDVLRMQFLLATVCESARLLPAGPLLQRCSTQHDLTLKSSIIIPAGAALVVPLHLVQMDVSIWGHDACEFNPNRLLEKGIDLGGLPCPSFYFHFHVVSKAVPHCCGAFKQKS
uniref:Uncharacterized protein n=2 Tax=Avena sativa TaxID=4498 RepID=A0ACD5UJ16_AVESA